MSVRASSRRRPSAGSRPGGDEPLAYELAQNPRQTLLGDPENRQKLGDGDVGVAPDEIDHPVMRAAEAEGCQNRVALGREVPIGEEEQLHPLVELVRAQVERVRPGFYVSHIDLYAGQC